MRKGEQTREHILHKAAELFNRQGYHAASMSDIMAATGLEKGGIYNHFTSKDDLALQAYEYAVDLMRQQFAAALKGKYHALDRLQAVIAVFQKITTGNPLPGGCPVINTAVQSTNTHPQLQAAAQQTMLEWEDFITRIIQRGIERNQLRADINPHALATLLISTLEGAILLTRLHQNEDYMTTTITHLTTYLTTLSIPT